MLQYYDISYHVLQYYDVYLTMCYSIMIYILPCVAFDLDLISCIVVTSPVQTWTLVWLYTVAIVAVEDIAISTDTAGVAGL